MNRTTLIVAIAAAAIAMFSACGVAGLVGWYVVDRLSTPEPQDLAPIPPTGNLATQK